MEQRGVGANLPVTVSELVVKDEESFIEDVRQALYAAKIVAYSQGFDIMRAGAEEYGWTLNMGAISRIWRAGCIIRAQFLDRIAEAYQEDPDLPLLMSAPYFASALAPAQEAWRRVTGMAIAAGIPSPVFASALSYYDGLHTDRLYAALIQGQRDFFGSHTYGRIDKEGIFHTEWSGDRTESRTDV